MGEHIRISVRNSSECSGLRPVVGGVALARGAAPKGTRFSLTEDNGKPVLLQAEATGTWPDGSTKWLMLDFQADIEAGSTARFTLSWDRPPARDSHEVPIESRAGKNFLLRTGNLEISPAEEALFKVSNLGTVSFAAIDERGSRCVAAAESVCPETVGPLRSSLRLSGSLRRENGERFLGFHFWVTVFAGLPFVKLEPMILADGEKGVVHRLRELTLQIKPLEPVRQAVIGGATTWKAKPGKSLRLMQVDDRQFRLEGLEGRGERAPGWIEAATDDRTIAAALRDFWQQWPKSIEAESGLIAIGFFPRFASGEFDHMLEPWYKHDYLFDGNCYRLRTGQARRWQVWLNIEGEGKSLSELANKPLVPAADPSQAMATGVWGSILPAGARGMNDYDRWVDNLFNGYHKAIDESRDYGAMNWGDWFGERGCNWGNHEYDTPRQFLVQFARTADPQHLYAGDTAARHMSEVDVVHFINQDLKDYFEKETPFRRGCITEPGLVHEHSVGHVGGFHSVQKIRELYLQLRVGNTDRPYLCLDPYNLGHVFTEGMMYDYFLTGDPWIKHTLEEIGNHLARLVEERKFAFSGHAHCGRENGWTALALAACYQVSNDERMIRAMKTLAEDALEEQDPNCGGWLYELPWGHCNCVKRKHVGEAAFIASIRLNGLQAYYKLSGDERIPEAIRRGVTHINRDTWNDKQGGWRYTSCPATAGGISRPGVTIKALSECIRLTKDPEHIRILRRAWEALFAALRETPKPGLGVGKALSSTIYGCPETASLIAELSEADEHTQDGSVI